MNVWQLAWRVSQHERRTFWRGWALFVLFFVIPVAIGWVLGRAFAALDAGATGRVLWWAVALLALETARMTAIHFGALYDPRLERVKS